MLGLLHLHGDRGGLPLLQGEIRHDERAGMDDGRKWDISGEDGDKVTERKDRQETGRTEAGTSEGGRKSDSETKGEYVCVFTSHKYALNDISILILFSGEIQFSLRIISGSTITQKHTLPLHVSPIHLLELPVHCTQTMCMCVIKDKRSSFLNTVCPPVLVLLLVINND